METMLKYNSNLQKAGAALEDVKILLRYWRNDIPQAELVKQLISDNVLGKKSRKRTNDVIRCTFLPRYINGYPESHWVYLKQLVESNVSIDIIKPILYFYAVLNEPLINDFVSKILLSRYEKGILDIDFSDTLSFIRSGIQDKSIPVNWSDAVIKRVASGLFAAIKEFGIIEGNRKRKIVSQFIPLPVFHYTAFFIFKEGFSGKRILEHNYWKLFLLNMAEIEHLFMEAHQEKYLRYERVGDVTRIEFNEETFQEAINVVIKRAA